MYSKAIKKAHKGLGHSVGVYLPCHTHMSLRAFASMCSFSTPHTPLYNIARAWLASKEG